MFIAHAPASYIASYYLAGNIFNDLLSQYNKKQLLFMGVCSGLIPDVDLLYFYFIDNRQTNHHEYLTHLPVFWLTILLFSLLISLVYKNKTIFFISIFVHINIFLHLILDTFVGGIKWFYPFSNISIKLFDVPAFYPSWILNFILHWTFVFELILIAVSICLWKQSKSLI